MFPPLQRITLAGIVLALLFAGGCGKEEAPPPPPPPSGIADLERLPQNPTAYLDPESADLPLVSAVEQRRFDADFDRRFFAPWHSKRATLDRETAFWGVADFGKKQGYAENLLPYDRAEWESLVAAQQPAAYPSLARPAIVVRDVPCRLFPTVQPFFLDPARAGEGFPFDYFQNSHLVAGTPLLVTHVSIDGAWYFVEAGQVFGWIEADALAWVDKRFIARYEKGPFAVLTQDRTTLRDAKGRFLLQSQLGAIFPLVGERQGVLRVLTPVRDADAKGVLRIALVPASLATPKPLPLTRRALATVADRMVGQRYGWGGLYRDRDCSATLRDLFLPFGLWLPRNSRAQAQAFGPPLKLDGEPPARKREAIVANAVPFYSLIWLRGHIGLYLGIDQKSGEPLILHNAWGVHTRNTAGEEGRAVIGRLAITTLRPGEERSDVPPDGYYERILGLVTLPDAFKETYDR